MKLSGNRQNAARRIFSRLAGRLRKEDLRLLLERYRDKLDGLGGNMPEALNAVVDDVKTMSGMLGSYSNGSYREIPWRSIAAIGGALLYFVIPVDALPDVVPIAGYLDDAFIIKLVVDLLRRDIDDFRRWRDGGIVIHDPAIEHERFVTE